MSITDDKEFSLFLHDTMDNLTKERFATIRERFEGNDKALKILADQMERRLEALNELRSEVTKDREDLVQKRVYDIQVQQYNTSVENFARRLTIIETRSVTWTAALGTLFLLVQLILHFWK